MRWLGSCFYRMAHGAYTLASSLEGLVGIAVVVPLIEIAFLILLVWRDAVVVSAILAGIALAPGLIMCALYFYLALPLLVLGALFDILGRLINLIGGTLLWIVALVPFVMRWRVEPVTRLFLRRYASAVLPTDLAPVEADVLVPHIAIEVSESTLASRFLLWAVLPRTILVCAHVRARARKVEA